MIFILNKFINQPILKPVDVGNHAIHIVVALLCHHQAHWRSSGLKPSFSEPLLYD